MKEGACLPNSYVNKREPRYRLGAAYIGWGNYRFGLDSDRYIRHPIQNIMAHGWLSAQPGFEVLSTSINPYFQYQTKISLHHGKRFYYIVYLYVVHRQGN